MMLVSMFSLFLGSSRPSVSRHNAENRALKKSAATSSRRFFFFFHFFASCFLRCALTLTERLEEARPQSAGIRQNHAFAPFSSNLNLMVSKNNKSRAAHELICHSTILEFNVYLLSYCKPTYWPVYSQQKKLGEKSTNLSGTCSSGLFFSLRKIQFSTFRLTNCLYKNLTFWNKVLRFL